jgi:hypothetical protein
MLGAPQQQPAGTVSPAAIAYINANVAHINSIFHAQNTAYNVKLEATQLVGGTNHFLHL